MANFNFRNVEKKSSKFPDYDRSLYVREILDSRKYSLPLGYVEFRLVKYMFRGITDGKIYFHAFEWQFNGELPVKEYFTSFGLYRNPYPAFNDFVNQKLTKFNKQQLAKFNK